MPTINQQTGIYAARKTNRAIGANKAFAWLDQIMAAVAGTASGEDALTILNRKLEATGVLDSGTADPVFANETALFYLNTSSNTLFIRGSSSYDEISAGHEGSAIIGHGTTNKDRSIASESDPWVYVNTNANKVWVKNRTGSPGSYSYSWSGPIFEGAYRTDIVYSTEDTPSNLNVSWNWETNTLNATGTGWSRNEGNAKWARILIGVPNSPHAIVSSDFPVGSVGFEDNVIIGIGRDTPTWNAVHSPTNPLIFYNTATAELWLKTRSDYRQVTMTAGDIGYDPPSTGNFPQSVDTVQDALDWLHTAVLGSSGGGGGASTAAQVSTVTTNFGQNIPTAANNVQVALDAVDNIDFPPEQKESWPRRSGAIEANGISQTFTVTQSLINQRSTYGDDLFIEATVNIRMIANLSPTNATATFVLDVLTSTNTVTGIQSDPVILEESGSDQDRSLSLSGILPSNFTGGELRIRRTAMTSSPSPTGFEGLTLQIRPDIKAKKVIINQTDLGNNFTGNSDNLEEITSEVDEFPIQPTDYKDMAWPDPPGGIDDDGVQIRRTVTIHRNIQNAIERGHNYIAIVNYEAQFVGTATDGRTDVNYELYLYTNLSGTPIGQQRVGDQSATLTRHNITINLPGVGGNAPSEFIAGFTVPTGQFDARLSVPTFEITFQEGIDPTGFTARGRILDNRVRTLQRFAQEVYDYVPSASGTTIDARNFDGNLSTTDNTLQEVAQAFDDYNPSGQYDQRVTFTGGNVNSSTPTNLGQITIDTGLRDEAAFELGYPIKITAGFQVNGTIAAGVKGRLYISNGTGLSDRDYGGINLDSNDADNSQLIFEAALPPEDGEPTSTNVPASVYVMLRRDTGTTAIAVDNGVVFLERDQTNQILNQHQDRFDFNSGERYIDELLRIAPSTSAYTINVPRNLLEVRTHEARAIRAVVRANLEFQSAGTTNIDFQIRNTNGAVLSPDRDIDQSTIRRDTNSFNIETSFELPSAVNGLRLQLTKGTGAGEPNVSFNYFDGFFQVVEPNALTAMEVLTNTASPGWTSPLTAHSRNVQLALEELKSAVAGASGQTERYQENIIWTAGSTPTSRLTTTSSTVRHTLIPGHTWAQYDLIQFCCDTGTDTGVILPIMITSSSFRINSAFGLLDVVGDYWVRIQRNGTNGFYFRWNGGTIGIRQILGIKTASR